jgi:hypothetical protein
MKQLKQFYVFDPEDVLINHFGTYKEAKEFTENKKHAHIHYLNECDSFSMLFLDAYYTNEYKGLEPMHYILTCKNYFMRITNPLKAIKKINRNGLSKYSHNSESIALYTIKDSYNPYNLLTFNNLKEIEDFHHVFKKQYTGKELEKVNKKKELYFKYLNKKYHGFNNDDDVILFHELYKNNQLPQYQMNIINLYDHPFDIVTRIFLNSFKKEG